MTTSDSSTSNNLDRRSFLKAAALASAAAGALAPLASASGPIFAPTLAPADAPPGSPGAVVPLAPPDKQPPNLNLPEPPTRKAGWAIVGLGSLALGEILPAFAECEHARVVALVSGHPDKAKQVAAAYQVDPKAIYNYENFGDLASNPAVDVIYIVLPNSMHREFTVRGLQAGKHVLCEKPMSVQVSEAEAMIAAATIAQRKLGIAYRLHFEPMHLKVMEMCQRQEFGKVKVFTSNNCQNAIAPNIRLSSALGGGPVGDLGVYSINAARYCIGEEPIEVSAMAQQPSGDPRFREVPESVTYTLRYPSGALASCTCSFGTSSDSFYHVICEKGVIKMDPAFSYRGLRLSISNAADGPRDTELLIPAVNQFAKEMDHFSRSVLENEPMQTAGEMGLADMKIVTAISESSKTGRAVTIA